jgi:hypothetical protein
MAEEVDQIGQERGDASIQPVGTLQELKCYTRIGRCLDQVRKFILAKHNVNTDKTTKRVQCAPELLPLVGCVNACRRENGKNPQRGLYRSLNGNKLLFGACGEASNRPVRVECEKLAHIVIECLPRQTLCLRAADPKEHGRHLRRLPSHLKQLCRNTLVCTNLAAERRAACSHYVCFPTPHRVVRRCTRRGSQRMYFVRQQLRNARCFDSDNAIFGLACVARSVF